MSVNLKKLAKQVDEALAKETKESLTKWLNERRMKVDSEKTLKVKLKGENIETFKSVLKKLNNTEKKVGFTNSPFNEKEIKFIKELGTKV